MKKALLFASGIAASTLPVAACTLSYFPLWKERGDGALLSGFAVLLLLLSFMPLYKSLRRLLHSPAVYTMWFIAFLLFFTVSKIANEMTVICFVGFISNLIGALFFKLSGIRMRKDEDRP